MVVGTTVVITVVVDLGVWVAVGVEGDDCEVPLHPHPSRAIVSRITRRILP
jgi:hypothetical protein